MVEIFRQAPAVLTYNPREQQEQFHRLAKRWNLVVCHRRFGKTVMGVNHLILDAVVRKVRGERRYAYIAPTYRQGKAVAWDYLKHFSKGVPGLSVSETELRVDYGNGSRIRIFGCDNPDALRGIYLDGVLLDEYDMMPQKVFGEVVRPALSDRAGFAIFMGTPKGRREIWRTLEAHKNDRNWQMSVHRASETGIIPKKELEDARKSMSNAQYLQEFECSFESAMNGDTFRRNYWKYYSELPLRQGRIIQSWDTAFKTGEESDYSVCVQAVECDHGLYITGVFRAKIAFPELTRAVRALYDAQRPHAVLIEDKASGQSLLQELSGSSIIPAIPVKPVGDKIFRANSASPFVEAGNVHLPEGAKWVSEFIEEFAEFPNGSHDDQVDALTQLVNWARTKRQEPTLRVIDLVDVVSSDEEFFGGEENGCV